MNYYKLFAFMLIAATPQIPANADSAATEYLERPVGVYSASLAQTDQDAVASDRNFCLRLFRQKSHGGKITKTQIEVLQPRVYGGGNSYRLTARTSNGYICQCGLIGNGAVSDANCVR